ncbi:MAG: hypothetical protein K2X03_26665 [Bryobacteraceae bacterium]|nr:hypothetical protein [Bryobacteraceae bacterium]
MALSAADREFLKFLYQRVRDHALQPDREEDRLLYQPLYESAGTYDPVAELQTSIEWNGMESVQFFSGFSGTGKTTEFYRLKKHLEKAGFSVVMADYQDYLSLSEPVEITELLLVIAGAFGDRIQTDLAYLNVNITKDNAWERLLHYLTETEVQVKEAGVKAEAGLEGFGKLGADLKLNLQSTPTFRQRIKKLLESRIGHLKHQVDQQIQAGVQEIWLRNNQRPIVFLFDSLEKLRGSFSNETDVRRSVEMLFSLHLPLLKFPNVHMVYAVPPWLKFIKQNVGSVVMLPTIRLRDREGQRYEAGWEAMRGFLEKRFETPANCEKLLVRAGRMAAWRGPKC